MTNVMNFLIEQGPLMAYVILFLGSLVEGESVVLTAGYLAYTGYLSYPKIITIAFMSTLFADQTLYFVGRIYGKKILKRFPHWTPRFEKAFALLHKYNTSFIFSFRFIYGIRTISPVMIGASGIGIQRFAILNVLAGALWAFASCSAGYAIGYFFADQIEQVFHTVVKSQKYILGGLLIILGLGFAYYRWRSASKG